LRIFEELADGYNQSKEKETKEKEGSQERGECELLKSQQLLMGNYRLLTLQQRPLLGLKRLRGSFVVRKWQTRYESTDDLPILVGRMAVVWVALRWSAFLEFKIIESCDLAEIL
jgi:hypothetical protein